MTNITLLYSAGERVIAPATPGAYDPVKRRGGPGVVVHAAANADTAGHRWVWVLLDNFEDPEAEAEPYVASELRPEPTI